VWFKSSVFKKVLDSFFKSGYEISTKQVWEVVPEQNARGGRTTLTHVFIIKTALKGHKPFVENLVQTATRMCGHFVLFVTPGRKSWQKRS
jgi:hypothetical protein